MDKRRFSLRKQLKSFNFAFQGYRTLFKDEHNSIVHLFGAFISIILGFIFDVSDAVWGVKYCETWNSGDEDN